MAVEVTGVALVYSWQCGGESCVIFSFKGSRNIYSITETRTHRMYSSVSLRDSERRKGRLDVTCADGEIFYGPHSKGWSPRRLLQHLPMVRNAS